MFIIKSLFFYFQMEFFGSDNLNFSNLLTACKNIDWALNTICLKKIVISFYFRSIYVLDRAGLLETRESQ